MYLSVRGTPQEPDWAGRQSRLNLAVELFSRCEQYGRTRVRPVDLKARLDRSGQSRKPAPNPTAVEPEVGRSVYRYRTINLWGGAPSSAAWASSREDWLETLVEDLYTYKTSWGQSPKGQIFILPWFFKNQFDRPLTYAAVGF